MRHHAIRLPAAVVAALALLTGWFSARSAPAGNDLSLFARSNLVAWCIVPFDAKKRGPEERAALLEKLGLRWFAYDYRAEHVPTFDAEMQALKRHNIRLLAWWFPGALNDEARQILAVLKRHELRAQLWISGAGGPLDGKDQEARVAAEARRVRPIAEAAGQIGCTVALYNHGGWGGEPENQVAVIQRLHRQSVTNVGIVYNLHHGHDHVDRFAELLRLMKPHLVALNLNGMARNGDRIGKKILPLSQGELDLQLLRIIRDSGWRGPVGVLNHTEEDAETRLRANMEGLDRLVKQLAAAPAGQPRAGEAKPAKDYWAVEDPKEREKLPLYQIIPAATGAELTPTDSQPPRETYVTWHRSHGDNGGRRYSALAQINRQNVSNLQVAWTYRAKDGIGNIQCNPIIVRGVMYAPIPSKHVVAVDAATGEELWRFKPEGRPAFRGLIYWPGQGDAAERLLFCAGKFLYALNPKTGQPIADFGEAGKTLLPGVAQGDFGAATAGPAIFERIIVVPGFEKDVWGFDVVTGKHLWTFHTVPHPGEFGHDTWDRTESYAANCWGGMAMDEFRGIAYVTTGGPKPNFIGVYHRGQNLFANCIIALNARTGERLWHFQEIRHDLWDLDIPSPPLLATITREGKRVDVVAVPTKMGNTLLLDRVSGKPIFPFRLRRAPTSDLPGEETFPYQPDPELPEPFSKMLFTKADLTDLSEEANEYASSQFASATTGFFRPGSEGRANLFFGIDGGAEWTGACVDIENGKFYVTANHVGWVISTFRDEDPPYNPRDPKTRGQQVFEQSCAQCHATNKMGIGTAPPLRGLRFRVDDAFITNQVRTGKNAMPAHPDMSEDDLKALVDYLLLRDRPLPKQTGRAERPRYNVTGYPKFYDKLNYPMNKPPWGTLNCLDLNTGKLLWKVPLGEYPELTAQGYPLTGTENYGGAIVTAGGLVFCAGTRDHKIRAFDKETGKELWAHKMPWVGSAPPATYEINGRQYVVIAATGGNKLGTPYGDAYIAFALPEDKTKTSAAASPLHFASFERFDTFTRATNNGAVSLESPWITPPAAWNELVASWNLDCPPGGHLKIEARAASADKTTPWYTLGLWSPDAARHPRESVRGQRDQFAEVKTDVLVCQEKMARAQVRVTLIGGSALPKLKHLGISLADTTATSPDRPANRAAWGRVIEVPQRAQTGWPDSDGWCSPTAVSMVLAHWAQQLKRPDLDIPVPDVAKAVFDRQMGGTGNWPFNTAFAGSFNGMRASVRRFADLREIEDWVASGVPVIASVSFDLLNGRAKDEGTGHLVVVVGFTDKGDVVLNDPWPNRKKENSVRKTYPRENFLRAWPRSRHTVYLIHPEVHSAPASGH